MQILKDRILLFKMAPRWNISIRNSGQTSSFYELVETQKFFFRVKKLNWLVPSIDLCYAHAVGYLTYTLKKIIICTKNWPGEGEKIINEVTEWYNTRDSVFRQNRNHLGIYLLFLWVFAYFCSKMQNSCHFGLQELISTLFLILIHTFLFTQEIL